MRAALRHGARGPLSLTAAAALALGTVVLSAPAYAATSSIDHVQAEGGTLQVVVSLADVPKGVAPELGTVTATIDDEPVEAGAELLSDSGASVERTAILAMDVSDSMDGPKFDQAKVAAAAFLDNVPADVSVGLVTFAADVEVVQEPTADVEQVRAALDTLTLHRRTRLYDGLIEAVKASGRQGVRSVLVLSDGRDTSSTSLSSAAAAVEDAGVKVDVVAIAQSPDDTALLQQLADAGNGQVLGADDPAALSALFADEAQALARQVLVTVTPPPAMAGDEGTLGVTLQVDDESVSDTAYVSLPRAPSTPDVGGGEISDPVAPAKPSVLVSRDLMYAGLGAAVLGVLVMVLTAVGLPRRSQDAVERSIEAYTRKGARRLAEAKLENESQSMTQQAVAVAASVLDGQKGLEAALGTRLEAGGLALKPAEWLLLHVGITLGMGVFGLLLGGGSVLFMGLGLVLGLVLPWLFLSLKRRRRLAAFKAQLADTLQLMSGSLSAGLSLAQSVDTVVREGTDPIAAEFRRALMESRIGVEMEDALMGVAERMDSVDFEWIVMAIRIQREVGGNLAELLNKVAETIREREYLQRQVKTLSAEGRLSVWILGGLPPAFVGYLMMVNRPYVMPLFTTPLGLVMVTVMVILLTAGILWMKKVVKVEV